MGSEMCIRDRSTIKHSEKLIKEGLHGAIFFGSTGCGQLISSKEKKKLFDKLNKNKFKEQSKNALLFKFCLDCVGIVTRLRHNRMWLELAYIVL